MGSAMFCMTLLFRKLFAPFFTLTAMLFTAFATVETGAATKELKLFFAVFADEEFILLGETIESIPFSFEDTMSYERFP